MQSLVTFAHGGLPSERPVEPVGLSACAEEAVRLVRLSHAGQQIAFVNRCDASVRLVGDRNRLLHILVNLLSNACDASRPGDTVDVRSTFENDLVSIEVVDEGGGIAPELRGHLLEPFFTPKRPGEGTGLGLALVYNIVSDHGGTIAIDDHPGHGTRVRVHVPLMRERHDELMQSTRVQSL